MEHRVTKEAERINTLCEHSRFSPTVVYWKSEKILSRYRDIRSLPTMVTKNTEEITEKTIKLIREKFDKTYVKKECAKTGSLDYILCEMPEMDGVETLSRIKSDPDIDSESTPIIALTANAISGVDKMYREHGFADYLSKPVDPISLEKILLKYLPKELIKPKKQ